MKHVFLPSRLFGSPVPVIGVAQNTTLFLELTSGVYRTLFGPAIEALLLRWTPVPVRQFPRVVPDPELNAPVQHGQNRI
jgi:hypothetical protein